MHVHANHVIPYTQLDGPYAAERAAAKQASSNTRKKLREFASKLDAESDFGEDCVVRLGAHEDSQEQSRRQNQQRQDGRKKQEEGADSDDVDKPISYWA